MLLYEAPKTQKSKTNGNRQKQKNENLNILTLEYFRRPPKTFRKFKHGCPNDNDSLRGFLANTIPYMASSR